MEKETKRKAIFFDRDGIVNERIIGDYVKKTDDFKLIDDFVEIFSCIGSDYLKILVTNQQGIGKGLMTEDDLAVVHEYMQIMLLEKTGKRFDDIFYCPELAGNGSKCRKPAPGMLLEAIRKWNIDIAQSWMIGDSLSDYGAGNNAGVRTILIGEYSAEDAPEADFIFASLAELSKSFEELIKKQAD